MKKILFLITCMSIGGAEKVLIDLVNNLDKSKYDITVMMVYKNNIYNQGNCSFDSYFDEDIKIKYMCNNDNKIIYRLFNMGLNRVNNKLIHKFFIGNDYDIEVAYYEGLPTKIIANSSNESSKKIAWLHTDAINRTKGYSDNDIVEEGDLYNNFDDIVAVSKSVANSFRTIHDNFKNVIVKYNPIRGDVIREKGKEDIEIYQYNCKVLISIGRLIKLKGYDRLINVLKRIKDDGLKFKLWLIGDGECRLELEKKVNEYGLNKEIIFLGFQKNPYKYLLKSDIYVCSSLVEGYSTVVLEAICAYKPIVTTDCSGMKEVFGDKQCGVICDNNEEELYKALKRLLSNQEDIKFYKSECIKRETELDLLKSIKEIEGVLG